MGVQGIVERYTQIQPKILFVDSEVLYNGKTLDLRDKFITALKAIREKVDSIEQTVVVTGRTWDDPTVYVTGRDTGSYVILYMLIHSQNLCDSVSRRQT